MIDHLKLQAKYDKLKRRMHALNEDQAQVLHPRNQDSVSAEITAHVRNELKAMKYEMAATIEAAATEAAKGKCTVFS